MSSPIVDADCHISSGRVDPAAITGDELVAQMDRAGIDRALVWLKPRYDKQIETENRAVHAACRRHPERLLGFGWVNPLLGRDAARHMIPNKRKTLCSALKPPGRWKPRNRRLKPDIGEVIMPSKAA